MRSVLVVLLGSVVCAPAGSSATPPAGPAPSELVRGEEGINALMAEACGTPCSDPLPAYANRVRSSQSGVVFVELDASRCRVPGFGMTPQECVGTCGEAGLESLVADFGPIGPTTSQDLCLAIEHDRGVAEQGSCAEVCSEAGGCTWPSTDDRAGFKLVGHLEVVCAAPVVSP